MFHCPNQLTTMETLLSLKCTLILRGLSSPLYWRTSQQLMHLSPASLLQKMLLSLLTNRSTNPWEYSIPNSLQDQEELPIYFWGNWTYQFAENLPMYHLQGKKWSSKPPLHSSSSSPGTHHPMSRSPKVTGRVQSPGAKRCPHHGNLPQIRSQMLSTRATRWAKDRDTKEPQVSHHHRQGCVTSTHKLS